MGCDEVSDGVAAELLARRSGELEGNRRLGDDRERLDRRDVASLDERLRGLGGLEVRGPQRPHEGRQWLHRGTDDELLAVRDAGLDAAGPVRLPVVALRVAEDLVVGGGAPLTREREAVADLDALDGLDPHERGGEAR